MTTALNLNAKHYQKEITDKFLALNYICLLGRSLPLTEDQIETFGFKKSEIIESLDDFIDDHESLFEEDFCAIMTRLFGYKSMAILNTENFDGTFPLNQNTRLRDIVYAHGENDTFTPSSIHIHDHKTTLTHSFSFHDLSSFIVMDSLDLCRAEYRAKFPDRNFDNLPKDEICTEINKVADSRGKGIADKVIAITEKNDLLFDFIEYDAVRYYQIIAVNESPVMDSIKLDQLIDIMKSIACYNYDNGEEYETITNGNIVVRYISQFMT